MGKEGDKFSRKEEGDEFLNYPTTKTYSLKIKNVLKVEKLASKLNVNKSEVINKVIEEYNEEKINGK